MSTLDRIPIWAVYLFTAGLVLLITEIGFRLGLRFQRRDPSFLQGSMPVAEVAGLLGLLGFLLAFSIGIAASNFDTRRQLVVADANAIGTCYLRAGFLAEPDRSAARDLLREYVDMRQLARDPAHLEDAIRRSEEIHYQLWSIVEKQAAANPESHPVSLFAESVNVVIDAYGERLAAVLSLRLPALMWIVLYGTTLLTLSPGYFSAWRWPRF